MSVIARGAPGARARATRSPPTRATRSQFVRGSGCRLWDAEGNEYLDFLAGISVLNVGHCHPRVVAGGARAGRARSRTRPTCTTPSRRMRLSARAVRELAGRQGVPLQLRRRGQRGGDQAGPPRAARRQRRRARRAPSTAAPTGRCRRPRRSPSRRRSRRWSPGSWSSPRTRPRSTAAVDERHRGGAARADPGRDRHPRALRRAAARPRAPPATEPARRSSSTRSRPGWGGPARCGPTSRPPSCPTR